MYAQVHSNGHVMPKGSADCLHTPAYGYSMSDREVEIESSDPDLSDLSDYYSDSGYPTRPRPRLVLWTSRRNNPLPSASREPTAPAKHQRKAGTSKAPEREHGRADSSHARTRRLPAVPAVRPVLSAGYSVKAFNKLRSLRNNRVIPASTPERERPPSSLVTTSISANDKGNSPTLADTSATDQQNRGLGQPPNIKQLRSFSLPSSDVIMAQAKLKKTKKATRTLSFSFGSGDKKKRARNIFGSLSRRSGEQALLDQSVAAPDPSSPILVGRRVVGGGGVGGTGTIFEEDTSSLSSVEGEEQRLNGVNYLHGSQFGSCRELSSAGLETESPGKSGNLLRPLSQSKHKRPSLPNFTKFQVQHRQTPQDPPGPRASTPIPGQEDVVVGGSSESPQGSSRAPREPSSPREKFPVLDRTPSSSATSSPVPRVRRRKLSDPGSAPSTPDTGNSPMAERRANGEETSRGVVRGGRTLRKGFTFCVSGDNLSPDWKEMRHHVVRFLLETEQSYVQSLRTIIKVYLEPLKRPQAFGLIDSSLVEDIFYQIPEICSLHERFLLQISQRTDRWHALQKIGDVFVNTFSKCHLMNIYTKFIHNFMRAKAAIEIAKQARPVFAKFLERAKYSMGKLSLDDLLIKPVQRIPRYLLFIKDLLKHTSASHPDHAPLQQALGELTGLAERVNEREREMARIDQQRELLASVDGLALFVLPESELVRYDLVTEAQGSAHKRDRFLILFSDVLVCASTRRKSTGLRRSSLLNLNTLHPDSFRYKIKWSAPLRQLSLGLVQAPMVERKKKNTLEKMIENLSKDEATLVQMLETSNALRKPHQPLTGMLKDMLSEVRESMSDKREELENLPLLHSRVDLMCYTSLPPTQYSIIFPSQKIRNSWEEDFRRIKQSADSRTTLASDMDSPSSPRPVREGELEFLHPLQVQSGRIGMELSCAGVGLPVDSDSPHNLWVACSDGYGGQVCLLDLQTSTRPHMVANITVSDSRILCMAAVPLGERRGETERADAESREGRSLCVSLSLESEVEEQDGPIGDQDAPCDNCAEGLESGPDLPQPELANKTSQSLRRDLRGSMAASFSSDSSSEVTGASISRTPSLCSTRSEPRADPSNLEMVPDVVGVASDVLDSLPGSGGRDGGFRVPEVVGSPRKNRFHRVRSNSAPDLLNVLAGDSPVDVFRRVEERAGTSLSPPPPGDSKFWSPLTLRSPPSRDTEEKDASAPPEDPGSSMWLGTEGGQILVYSPGSNLRSRSNRSTIQLPAAVHCIRHHRGKVYAGLADGRLAVLDPHHPAAGHTHFINISSAPVVSCVTIGGQLLAASQDTLYQVHSPSQQARPLVSLPENRLIQFVEGASVSGEGRERVWVSVRDMPLLHLYHLPTKSLLTTVDCSLKIHDVLRGYNPIIRQNKTACLRITSLLPSSHHLLIGTSAGIILTLPHHHSSQPHPSQPDPSQPDSQNQPSDPPPVLCHLPQGHVDSSSFLCELRCQDSTLVLSGGTGYEDFGTCSTAQGIAETSSCLLIWRLAPQQD